MEMEVFTGVVDSWGSGIAFALPPPKVSEPGAPAMPAPAASSWRIREPRKVNTFTCSMS